MTQAQFSPEAIRAAVFDALGSVAPEADPTSIDPERPLRDQVDLDSMDFLNVIIRLSELLGVAVPEKDYAKLNSINAAVEYLAHATGTGSEPARG
jgi:acyl carrier protein